MSRFKDKITASTSGLAHASMAMARRAIAAPATEEQEAKAAMGDLAVTPKASGKHRPYRRLIKYDREGPLYRQIGVVRIGGVLRPIMQTYFLHRFKHATKGERVYSGGPTIRLPNAPPAVSPVLAFYGSHGPARRVKVAA